MMKRTCWNRICLVSGVLAGLPFLWLLSPRHSQAQATQQGDSLTALIEPPDRRGRPRYLADVGSSRSRTITQPPEFTPPLLPDRGRPRRGRSSGGASRGSCDTPGQLPLTALVPVTSVTLDNDSSAADSSTYESVFSLTSLANPTFWFYVPYSLEETPVEFVLQDEQNNTLYQTRLTDDQSQSGVAQSGVISITLPEAEVTLQPDTLYHWYFLTYCDESSPAFVEGWAERTTLEASLSASLQAATVEEQIRLYARNGIWQEAITLLGEQYRADQSNAAIAQDWISLLNSVDLEEVAQQPLTDCCVQ